MKTELHFNEEGSHAESGWLAGWLLREGQTILPRWKILYQRVAALPHNWRRQMRRKLAVSLSGAALLLALAGPIGPAIVHAEGAAIEATIAVVNGEVGINDNNKCSLIEAIINANATGAGQMKADCKSGNVSGADTISLPTGGLFNLTQADNDLPYVGANGLPLITSNVTIEGNGSTIRRSYTTGDQFRILAVDPNGRLTLRNITLRNGYAPDDQSGGAVDSRGELIIENSTIAGNRGGPGGGVAAVEATISGSRITNNVSSAYLGGQGGGIAARSLTLINSTVEGNTAEGSPAYDGGWGGGVSMNDGTISGSTISNNVATSVATGGTGEGGGVRVGHSVTIANSTISGNEATLGGGVFDDMVSEARIVNSTISANSADDAGGGL